MSQLLILPDTVTETWTWTIDLMSTWDGSESRFALQSKPRVEQSLTFNAVTEEERRDLWRVLAEDLRSPDTQPLYGWGATLTAASASGTDTISVDTTRLSLNLLDRIVLIDPETGVAEDFTILAVTDSTVQLSANLSQNVDETWLAYKGLLCILSNESSIRFRTVAGSFQVTMSSWQSPEVQRTGTTAALTTFNSLPVLERKALADAAETLQFEREIIDFGLGSKVIGVGNTNVDVRLRRAFRVVMNDSADLDYWRLFFDTVQGGWKAFLMSTQLEDLTLAGTLSQGGTTMLVNEVNADTLFQDFASFQNFEIEYSDGTSSRHTITDATGGTITFTPALPNDPKVANVDRISYLLKVRMGNQCRWQHGSLVSRITFDTFSTDDG